VIADALVKQANDIGMLERCKQKLLAERSPICRVQELDGNTLRKPFTSLTKIDRAVATNAKPLKQTEGPEIGGKECVRVIPRRHRSVSLLRWNNSLRQRRRTVIQQACPIPVSIRP